MPIPQHITLTGFSGTGKTISFVFHPMEGL